MPDWFFADYIKFIDVDKDGTIDVDAELVNLET